MKKEKDNKENKEKKPLINRFSQFIVFFTMIYGLGLTTVSYIWSALGFEPLVDLSSIIVQTIVAPCTIWIMQNCLCNIFENNKLIFSTPLSVLNSTQKQTEEVDDINIINLDDEKEITDYGTDT